MGKSNGGCVPPVAILVEGTGTVLFGGRLIDFVRGASVSQRSLMWSFPDFEVQKPYNQFENPIHPFDVPYKVPLNQNAKFFRVVTGTVFYKTSADPTTERVIKVQLPEGYSIRTTGRTYEGRKGNLWAELDTNKTKCLGPVGWICVLGPGLGYDCPLLVIDEEWGLVVGPPRRKPSKRALPSTSSEDEGPDSQEEDEGTPDVGVAKPTGQAMHFQVIGKSLAVRGGPSKKAPSVGGLGKGRIVYGLPYKFGENPWLRIDNEECQRIFVDAEEGWVMIHGTCLGMGQLLRKLNDEEQEEQQKNRKPIFSMPEDMSMLDSASALAVSETTVQTALIVPSDLKVKAYYEVISDKSALVYGKPAPSAPDPSMNLENIEKGKFISGTVSLVNGIYWLCIDDDEECKRLKLQFSPAYVPIKVGMDLVLRLLSAEEERTYLAAQNTLLQERAKMEEMKQQAEAERLKFEQEKLAFEKQKPSIRSMPEGRVKDWNVQQVADFLEFLELGKFVASFREQGIDGEMLTGLSEQDLVEEMGLPKLPARKIVKQIAKMSS